MRKKFDEQLGLVSSKLREMGTLCEESIAVAAEAISDGDKGKAGKTFDIYEDVKQLRKDIESICMRLMLQQQPVARDFRQISAALRMITDLERISEQTSDISEIIRCMDDRLFAGYPRISIMAEGAIKMVTESIEAYVRQDLELAESVIEYDDVLDDDFTMIKRDLIDYISENPDEGEYALDLLMTAKYLEKIADHAVNVAKWVLFFILGNPFEKFR